MTESTQKSSAAAGEQDPAENSKFDGALGSQHKQTQENRPELQQGASGGSPRPQQPPAAISGQLGGVGGQTASSSAPSGSGSAPQPGQPQRKSGCFGVLLVLVCVGAVLASGISAF